MRRGWWWPEHETDWPVLWRAGRTVRTGQQHGSGSNAHWELATVNILTNEEVYIRFEGLTGNDHLSDMAIDYIRFFYEGPYNPEPEPPQKPEIINKGTINNYSGGTIHNYGGIITNNDVGIITNNDGVEIINYSGGEIFNNGNITNEGGKIINNVR